MPYALLAAVLLLSGCGILKPDPTYLHGPKVMFEQQERWSGGTAP